MEPWMLLLVLLAPVLVLGLVFVLAVPLAGLAFLGKGRGRRQQAEVVPADAHAEAVRLLGEDKLIEATRTVMRATGWNLRRSKAYCDGLRGDVEAGKHVPPDGLEDRP